MPKKNWKDHVGRKRRRSNRPGILSMLETAPARVAAPVVQSTLAEPLPDEDLGWEPLDLPRAVRSHRTYRIPVIVIAIASAVGIYFAAQFALHLPLAHAEGRRVVYDHALRSTADSLPDLTAAAIAVTEPAFADDLGPHLAALARIEGLSAALHAEAGRPLPPVVPGLPTEDLVALEPIRDRMDAIADRLTAVAVVLTDVATYRRALDTMFLLPELPGPDEGPSVAVFSDRLSDMTAATVSAAALLPVGELFSEHRSQVEELLIWLPVWQAAYLEALRDDDLTTAESLRAEAIARIDQLHQSLDGPLEAAATWTSTTIEQIRADIDAALVLVG